MTPILILAAGASSRMRGADKLLELVDGRPLLATMCERALATDRPVFVALPTMDHPRAAVLPKGVRPLIVSQANEGMGATMRGAVALLPDCAAFMLLLGDLPEISSNDIEMIWTARDLYPDHVIWRGATTQGKPGHPIVFDASLRPKFADLRGDTGGEDLVKPLQSQTHLTRFDTDRARLDLDTPEDWAAWRARR